LLKIKNVAKMLLQYNLNWPSRSWTWSDSSWTCGFESEILFAGK